MQCSSKNNKLKVLYPAPYKKTEWESLSERLQAIFIGVMQCSPRNNTLKVLHPAPYRKMEGESLSAPKQYL